MAEAAHDELPADAGSVLAADAETEAAVRLAAYVTGARYANVNVVAADSLCQIAAVGFTGRVIRADESMCAVALRSGDVVHTTDARSDDRFAGNPWVTGVIAQVRGYAAAPIRDLRGTGLLGTVCVFDDDVMPLSDTQLARLADVADLLAALRARRGGD